MHTRPHRPSRTELMRLTPVPGNLGKHLIVFRFYNTRRFVSRGMWTHVTWKITTGIPGKTFCASTQKVKDGDCGFLQKCVIYLQDYTALCPRKTPIFTRTDVKTSHHIYVVLYLYHFINKHTQHYPQCTPKPPVLTPNYELIYLFILFKIMHQSKWMLKQNNVTLLKITTNIKDNGVPNTFRLRLNHLQGASGTSK
jgi:hypothetical protein